MKKFLRALTVSLFVAQPVVAEDIEAVSDEDIYQGFVIYEHPTCRVKFVSAGPLMDEMYIEGRVVALIDISRISYLDITDFLDRLLGQYGLPSSAELEFVQCT